LAKKMHEIRQGAVDYEGIEKGYDRSEVLYCTNTKKGLNEIVCVAGRIHRMFPTWSVDMVEQKGVVSFPKLVQDYAGRQQEFGAR
jgi:hypothetical protein